MTYFMMCLVFLYLSGCKGKETSRRSTKAEKQSDVVIALSVLTMTNVFFQDIAEGMIDEAKKHGYEVLITSAENDPATQYNQVKDFIVKKVIAIVLTPADSKAVGTAIKEANKAGIPIFTADIACLAKDVKVVSHIATDNYAGGKLAAKAMMEVLENKGKVAIIDNPEVESVLSRTRGFRNGLKEANSNIEVIGAWPGQGTKDESFKVALDILTAYKDLDGIFAINDPAALGAYAALEKKNLTDEVVIVGFDAQPEARQAILEGKIYADPVQFPKQIGRKTIETIVKYLEGEEIPPQILIPPELYYKEDAEKDPSLKVST